MYNLTTLCLNGTLSCVHFMEVIIGDLHNLTKLCLNGTLSCVHFVDVTMGDVPTRSSQIYKISSANQISVEYIYKLPT